MPVDKSSPEFKKAVADAVGEVMAARDKKAKPPKDYAELEDRLSESIADRVLAKLAGEEPEEDEEGVISRLFFGGGRKAASGE